MKRMINEELIEETAKMADSFTFEDKKINAKKNLGIDEIDNSDGNAMLRYKTTEKAKPIVFGSSEKPTVLMGSGTRPTYSKSGSDFVGSDLALKSDVDAKQDKLVSGTSIKTVNGNSLLGSGNITISGGGGDYDNVPHRVSITFNAIDGGDSAVLTLLMTESDLGLFKTGIIQITGQSSFDTAVSYLVNAWSQLGEANRQEMFLSKITPYIRNGGYASFQADTMADAPLNAPIYLYSATNDAIGDYDAMFFFSGLANGEAVTGTIWTNLSRIIRQSTLTGISVH